MSTTLPEMPASPADPAASTVAAVAAAPTRRWEIDALRGLMLVLMTCTHIPTRFSAPFGQPFGFVSAAEGFVLLSAYVAGLVYTRRLLKDGVEAMRAAFLKRAVTIYVCQAALLVFLLALVAAIGVATEQPAITNLVAFFLERPTTAFFSGLLLLYNPPLLDILPMYIVFLLASPLVLLVGTRHGWGAIVLVSGAIWLAAQFGLSQAAYDALVRVTGLPVPFRETGSFEILAWQFLWVIGLWMGAGEASGRSAVPERWPRAIVVVAVAFAAGHFVWRHALGQTPFPHHPSWNLGYDKWHLAPLRLLDVLALLVVALRFGPWLVARCPRWRPLEALGRQSLPVFCVHLVLAIGVLLVFGEIDPTRSWAIDGAILAGCFAILFAVSAVGERLDRGAAVVIEKFRARRAIRRARRTAPARPVRRPRWRLRSRPAPTRPDPDAR